MKTGVREKGYVNHTAMDFNQLAPQTRRVLQRLDVNRDQRISARELKFVQDREGLLIGVAPEDQTVLREALKNAKAPEVIIVNLVDEQSLPPGYTPPAPLFQEESAQRLPRSGSVVPSQSPVQVRFKPHAKETRESQGEQQIERLDMTMTTQLGGLELNQRTTLHAESQQWTGELAARYQMGGLSLRASTDMTPILQGQESRLESVQLTGETQLGQVRLNTTGQLGLTQGRFQTLSTTAEYQVLEGHGIRAQIQAADKSQRGLGWSSMELGSSHQLGSGWRLRSQVRLDESTAQPVYGAGFEYEIRPGLRLEAQADTSGSTQVKAGYKLQF